MSHRSAKEADAEKFNMQTYWRLLGYTRKYWKRMTIGILAGFLVGGSLLAGLMMLPEWWNRSIRPVPR